MKRSLLAMGTVALMSLGTVGTAAAADVYWSVGVQGPGVITQVGNRPPPPQVVVVHPGTIYAPAPPHYRPPQSAYHYGPPQVVVYPQYQEHRPHGHWRDRRRDEERHGHGRFDAHGGRWGDGDRRDEYGDRWRR